MVRKHTPLDSILNGLHRSTKFRSIARMCVKICSNEMEMEKLKENVASSNNLLDITCVHLFSISN